MITGSTSHLGLARWLFFPPSIRIKIRYTHWLMSNLEKTRSMFNIEEKIIPFQTRVGIGQVAGPGLFLFGSFDEKREWLKAPGDLVLCGSLLQSELLLVVWLRASASPTVSHEGGMASAGCAARDRAGVQTLTR
jgi:hypothetical protein